MVLTFKTTIKGADKYLHFMMKLLKENVKQSTLTQTNHHDQEKPLCGDELSIKTKSRSGERVSQEDGTARAKTSKQETDWVLKELKDDGG